MEEYGVVLCSWSFYFLIQAGFLFFFLFEMNSIVRHLRKTGPVGGGQVRPEPDHTAHMWIYNGGRGEWTVNKLAFKQDNLGLRVLGAKQNTALDNWYKLLTHGSLSRRLWTGEGKRAASAKSRLIKNT